MTPLVTYFVALVCAGMGSICLRLGLSRGVPLIGTASLAASAALIAASWTLPHVVFDDDQYLHDFFSVLEMINKSATGLLSSKDYESPIGPLYDWIFRVSSWFRAYDATSLPLANALFAILAALYGIALLRRQISVTSLGLVTLIAVATILSPRDLDRIIAQTQMNWLAPYNRWASGVMVFPVLALCIPGVHLNWWHALLIGIGIAALMLIKVTYGAAILGLLTVAVVLKTLTIRNALGAIVGAVLFFVLLDALTAGQLRAYAQDVLEVAEMPTNGLRLPKAILQFGEAFLWAGAGLLLYVTVCKAMQRRWETRAIGIMVVAAAMGCAVLMQNHWFSESTIYAVLPLIAAEWSGLFRLTNGKHVPKMQHVALITIAAGLALIYPVRDSGTLVAQHIQALRLPPDQHLASYPRSNFVVPARQLIADGTLTARQYQYLLDGLEALRQADVDKSDQVTVLALYFTNPFPYLLESPSPRRTPIWFDEGRTFTEESHLSNKEMFDGVDVVMRSSDGLHGTSLWKIYGRYVEAHFRKTATVGSWTVYLRES